MCLFAYANAKDSWDSNGSLSKPPALCAEGEAAPPQRPESLIGSSLLHLHIRPCPPCRGLHSDPFPARGASCSSSHWDVRSGTVVSRSCVYTKQEFYY